MERINLAVVVAALVVLVMSAVKPASSQGDYELQIFSGAHVYLLNTNSGEVWKYPSTHADPKLAFVPCKRAD